LQYPLPMKRIKVEPLDWIEPSSARDDDESGTRATPLAIPRRSAKRLLERREAARRQEACRVSEMVPKPRPTQPAPDPFAPFERMTSLPPERDPIASIVVLSPDRITGLGALGVPVQQVDDLPALLRSLIQVPEKTHLIAVLDCRHGLTSARRTLGWIDATAERLTLVFWGDRQGAKGGGERRGLRWLHCAAETDEEDLAVILKSLIEGHL